MMTDEIITIRLPWAVTCRLACQALVERLTFDQLCEQALVERMQQLSNHNSNNNKGVKRHDQRAR